MGSWGCILKWEAIASGWLDSGHGPPADHFAKGEVPSGMNQTLEQLRRRREGGAKPFTSKDDIEIFLVTMSLLTTFNYKLEVET